MAAETHPDVQSRPDEERTQSAHPLTAEDFRTLADNLPTLCWMADVEGSIFWSNRRWYSFTGTTPESRQDWGSAWFHDPQWLPKVQERWQLSVTTGMPFEMTFPLRGADDVMRPFLTRAEPMRDDAGNITRWFGTNVDISEQVAAEDVARANAKQFHTFAQAMPNHVWTAPADGMLDWFNDRVYEYSGEEQGALDGQGWTKLLHPDDLMEAGQKWTVHALTRHDPYEAEFRLRRADGVYRWHLARAIPIMDDGNAPTRWIGSNTDIEEQKSATAALASLNISLAKEVAGNRTERDRVWQLSNDLMVVTDFDSTIVAVNPAWKLITGWDEQDLVGKLSVDIIHADDLLATADELSKLRQGVTSFRFKNRYRRKDGTYATLDWTAVPDHQFIHAVGRDVTLERERDVALLAAEDALRQAQKMEAVGQLTGGIAHDFNNMLAVVIGSLDLIERRLAKGKDPGEFIKSAMEGARRAATLTHRLLAFSRQLPLAPEALDPNRVVANVSEMLQRTLGEETQIETVLAGGLWKINADAGQIENSIVNLAINARDAMPGGGKLTIETANSNFDDAYARAHRDIAAGQYVMIAVSDTGAGMTPETIAKAFDPFFTTKGVGKGTGLGLSQVYGFVRQSRGHIKIYSELGLGTAVKIYLPRYTGDAEHATATEHRPVTPLGTMDDVVLVVEDDDRLREISAVGLRDLGYTVLHAPSAADALKILRTHPQIAVLFTDIVMPEMNGRKLADEAMKLNPQLKVLFTTGYARNAVVHNGVLDAGVNLLAKPFTLNQLGQKIREMIDG